MGRRSKFRPAFVKEAQRYCQLGATDQELCEFFGVSVQTLNTWKRVHPKFAAALKVGKEKADDRVERSLYAKAIGYKHEAVKIFMPAGADKPVYAPYIEHVAPDTIACIFWLKNRRPDLWRDRAPSAEGGDGSGSTTWNITMNMPAPAIGEDRSYRHGPVIDNKPAIEHQPTGAE